MWNPLSVFEMYRGAAMGVKHPGPIGILLLILIAGLGAPGPAAAQCPPLEAGSRSRAPGAASRGPACRVDETLTRMFTPRAVPRGTYLVYVTEVGLDEMVGAFKALSPASNPRGAWTPGARDPLDAFGEAGPYDRSKVARLYVGLRARVARGPIVIDGRTVASITLISPYPDPSLTRLRPGTLIIEFRIAPEWRATMTWQDQLQGGDEVVGAIWNPR